MTTLGQHRDNFGTASGHLWDNFKQVETTSRQFWRNFGTTLRQLPDRHGTTFGQLLVKLTLGQLWDLPLPCG